MIIQKVFPEMEKSGQNQCQAAFETPQDGDRILITFKDHRNSWYGPFIYREHFNDSERGPITGVCVYSEIWAKKGEFARSFDEVEFWQVWEGESLESYDDRKKLIITDLQQKHLPIDPIDSFVGENAIQGVWSKPKIGPAFTIVPVEGKWKRPKDGALIEVHSRESDVVVRGRYFAAADMIYREERLIERRTVRINQFPGFSQSALIPAVRSAITGEGMPGSQVETVYSDRVRYDPPQLPFAEWIRFRLISEALLQELTDEPEKSEWQDGPYFHEWWRESRKQQIEEAAAQNEALYARRIHEVERMLRKEPVLSVRIVRLGDLVGDIRKEPFDTTLEPDGQGEYFKSEFYRFLLGEQWVLERAYRLDHTLPKKRRNPSRSKSTQSRRPREPKHSLAFRTLWVPGMNDPALAQLNESLRQAELIDENSNWTGTLGYLGALIRLLCERGYVLSPSKARDKLGSQMKILQKNGEYQLIRASQIRDAVKRAGIAIPTIISRIVDQMDAVRK